MSVAKVSMNMESKQEGHAARGSVTEVPEMNVAKVSTTGRT